MLNRILIFKIELHQSILPVCLSYLSGRFIIKMATINPSLLPGIPKLEKQIIAYAQRNNQLLRTLDHDSLTDSYWSGVTGLIDDPSGSTIETQKELITALTAKTVYSALKEYNQRRNDAHILTGFSGVSVSRYEYVRYPDEFLETLPERQCLIAKCRNMRMTYSEICEALKLKTVESQIHAIAVKYKEWSETPAKLPQLTQEELSRCKSTEDRLILEWSKKGLKISLIAERLNQDPAAISRRKYALMYGRKKRVT